MIVAAHGDIGVVEYRARIAVEKEARELRTDGSLYRFRQVLGRTEMQNDRHVARGLGRVDQIVPEFEIDRRAVGFDAVGDLLRLRVADLGILPVLFVHDRSVGIGIPDGVAPVDPFLEGFSASVPADPLDRQISFELPEVVVPDVYDLFERAVGAVLVEFKVNRVQKNVAARRDDHRVEISPFRQGRVVWKVLPVFDRLDQSLHRVFECRRDGFFAVLIIEDEYDISPVEHRFYDRRVALGPDPIGIRVHDVDHKRGRAARSKARDGGSPRPIVKDGHAEGDPDRAVVGIVPRRTDPILREDRVVFDRARDVFHKAVLLVRGRLSNPAPFGGGALFSLRDKVREVVVVPIVFGKPVFDRQIRRSRTDRDRRSGGGGEGDESAVLRRRCGADRKTADQDRPVARGDARNVVVLGPRAIGGKGKFGISPGRAGDEDRGGIADHGALYDVGTDRRRDEIDRVRRVEDVHRVQQLIGRIAGRGADLEASPIIIVLTVGRIDLNVLAVVAVDQIVLIVAAARRECDVVADHVLDSQRRATVIDLHDLVACGIAVRDVRFVSGVQEEGLFVTARVGGDIVEDEEIHRDLGVVGVVDDQHPARDLRYRRGGVRRGDIAGNVGVGRRRLRLIGVAVGDAGHLAGLVGVALPVGEVRVGQPLLPAAVIAAVGRGESRVVDQQTVVRDRRLVVILMVRVSVIVVDAGIARQHCLVEDLERAGVVVVVVCHRALSDLHQHRRLASLPSVPGNDLPEPAAVIEDEVHPLVAVRRRLQSGGGADQVFGCRRRFGQIAGEVRVT